VGLAAWHPASAPGSNSAQIPWPWRAALLHVNNTRWLLADGRRRSCVPSRQTPRSIMLTLLHPGTNLRTVRYALPAGLHKHVQTIAPTTAFTSTPSTAGGDATQPLLWSGECDGGREPVDMLLRRQPNPELMVNPSRLLYGTVTYSPRRDGRESARDCWLQK
jgi:hypothetical protein